LTTADAEEPTLDIPNRVDETRRYLARLLAGFSSTTQSLHFHVLLLLVADYGPPRKSNLYNEVYELLNALLY
jgi:hypothetical protein